MFEKMLFKIIPSNKKKNFPKHGQMEENVGISGGMQFLLHTYYRDLKN